MSEKSEGGDERFESGDRSGWRLIAAALVLGVLCTAGVLATLKADAQIKDDPAVAPDVRESADDNVTFPTDI